MRLNNILLLSTLINLLITHNAFAEFIAMSKQQIKQANIKVTHPVALQNTSLSLNLLGKIAFNQQSFSTISSPVAGVVESSTLETMKIIGSGQTVATIYSPDVMTIQNELLQLKTQIQLAQQTLKREQTLFNEGIIAQKRVFEAQHNVKLLELQIAEKQRLLKFYGASPQNLNPSIMIRSKQSGTVSEVYVTAGQHVDAGMPLAKIIKDGSLRLELHASKAQLNQINLGDKVLVSQNGCELTGKISQKSLIVDPQTQQHTINVALPNNRCVQANQLVSGKVFLTANQTGLNNRLLVPKQAVIQYDRQFYVFVLKNNGFKAVPVKVTPASASQFVIESSAITTKDWLAINNLLTIKSVWSGIGEEQKPTPINEPSTQIGAN